MARKELNGLAVSGTLTLNGEAVSAGSGLPEGGTAGQYLTPDGSGGTAWDDLPAAGISDAPSDGENYSRRNGAWEAIPRFITVLKTADETRVNTTTHTDDAELVSPTLATNATYRFELLLVMTGNTVNDFKFRVERTGLTDAEFRYAGDLDNSAAPTFTFDTNLTAILGGTAIRMGNYIGFLRTGTDPGTINVAWAQNVAGEPAVVTTLLAGSMLMLRRLV